VRIGLVGCGKWGRYILRDLKALNCYVSVAVPSAEGGAIARGLGADQAVRSLDELPAVDGIVIATPTATHGKLVLEALESRNCPIFCEKPLTNNIDEAKQIVQRDRGRVFVMDKWRYHPGIQALRDIAHSQEIGRSLGLRTERLSWGLVHADSDAAWVLLPHDLSIALEISGQIPRPVSAHAESDSSGLMTLSAWLQGPVWMACEASLRFPGHQRVVELRCEGGIARLSNAYDRAIQILHTDRWIDSTTVPAWTHRAIGDEMPLLAELSAFIDYLRGGPPPRSSAVEGLRAVETIAELRAMAGLKN